MEWILAVGYAAEAFIGADNLLCNICTNKEILNNYDNIKPALAPIKINILPLIKKKHARKAKELYMMLAKYCMVQYEESGSIGKRYRRGDAIGIPYAITVDDTTMEQDTVTVRDRDTMEQCVVPVGELMAFFVEKSLI